MPQLSDLSRSLVALDQDSTIIAVVELSQSSWLVAGVLPGIERQPRKQLEPSAERLLGLLHRWRDEAVRAGSPITRIALAFEAGPPARGHRGEAHPKEAVIAQLGDLNLVYTGVTRGKRLVVLVGQRKALAIAIKGSRARRRWSKLRSCSSPCARSGGGASVR